MPDINKIKEALKKYKYILLLGAAGMLLLILPVGGGKSGAESSTAKEESANVEFSLSAYEKKVEKILSEVKGVGSVKVMLYLSSGAETVYTSDGSYGKNVAKQLYPAFGGAVVVCDGGGSQAIALKVTQALASLTGLGSDKITVLSMR